MRSFGVLLVLLGFAIIVGLTRYDGVGPISGYLAAVAMLIVGFSLLAREE